MASPDIDGIKRAQLFREMLERKTGKDVELAFVEKRRDSGVVTGGAIVGDVSGRAVIVLDDLCASGGTLTRAASALRSAGATSVYAAVTHIPIEAGVAALAASDHIAQIVTTDSVGYSPKFANGGAGPGGSAKLKILSASELLGCALSRMVTGKPLAPLSEHWPPP